MNLSQAPPENEPARVLNPPTSLPTTQYRTYLQVRTIIVDRGPVLGLLITYPSSVSRVFSRSLGARSIGQDILSTRPFSLSISLFLSFSFSTG